MDIRLQNRSRQQRCSIPTKNLSFIAPSSKSYFCDSLCFFIEIAISIVRYSLSTKFKNILLMRYRKFPKLWDGPELLCTNYLNLIGYLNLGCIFITLSKFSNNDVGHQAQVSVKRTLSYIQVVLLSSFTAPSSKCYFCDP